MRHPPELRAGGDNQAILAVAHKDAALDGRHEYPAVVALVNRHRGAAVAQENVRVLPMKRQGELDGKKNVTRSERTEHWSIKNCSWPTSPGRLLTVALWQRGLVARCWLRAGNANLTSAAWQTSATPDPSLAACPYQKSTIKRVEGRGEGGEARLIELAEPSLSDCRPGPPAPPHQE